MGPNLKRMWGERGGLPEKIPRLTSNRCSSPYQMNLPLVPAEHSEELIVGEVGQGLGPRRAHITAPLFYTAKYWRNSEKNIFILYFYVFDKYCTKIKDIVLETSRFY